MVRYGKYEDQIDIIPSFGMYIHRQFNGEPWHFHFYMQWIFYYFELTIGKSKQDT